MEKEFPLEFTLEDGTHVVVKKAGGNKYDFELKPEDGAARHFTIDGDEKFTDEKEKELNFDELNALRRFWLETRDAE